MASHKETFNRRHDLLEGLRLACRSGEMKAGEMLPSVRDLAGQYRVSHRIVTEVIQTLTDEGMLYSLPRKGTFVGKPHQAREGLYLLITDTPIKGNDQLGPLRFGFEEQISAHGGTCLTVPLQSLDFTKISFQALALEGIFYVGKAENRDVLKALEPTCPLVFQSESRAPVAAETISQDFDTVYFDNEGSGYQIAQYLMKEGHERVAFFGLHSRSDSTSGFTWSRERAAGWARALREAGTFSEDLLVLPDVFPDYAYAIERQEAFASEQARRLLHPIRTGAVTAVATVNVHVAQALVATFRESDLSPRQWPVITTFGIGDSNVTMMTSMLLPWEQLGRKGADLLWSRSLGMYVGKGRRVSVPMRLITRLSCRPDWNVRPEAALWANSSKELAGFA